MRPARWQDIKKLYHGALECEEAERAGFLDEACSGDERLRTEVESLLGYDGRAEGFINSPALEAVARKLSRDRASSVVGKQFGAYRVLSLLGAGGMGEVYLAQDTSLDRQVALKFLPEDFQNDETARGRFMREARSAAALDHPFICNVHEIVEVDGRDFISMEYVEGQTLRDKLLEGPLPPEQALKVGSEIAEALEKAHAAGIVHRDLKPSNVMLTSDGHVKVMDFGLAKRVAEEAGSRNAALMRLTQEGAVIGSVSYMSPEQLRGDPADTRSDLFSFGVLLYEMLTGVHPFEKPTRTETASSILKDDPSPLTGYCDESPDLVMQMARRLLAKDPGRRYQSIHDVRADLDELLASVTEERSPFQGRYRTRGLIAVITVLSVVSSVVLVGWYSGVSTALVAPGEITSLAVLPLENLSGNEEQAFVVQGMHHELIHNLARIGALRVISRSSVMRYAEQNRPLAEIAEELSVDALVEGTVRREGDQVRVTAQLIAFNPERHLWSGTLEGDIRDALTLQSDVATVVAAEILVALSPEERSRLARSRPIDPRVLDAYMKGLAQRDGWSRESLPRAIDYFHKALDIDPGFAEAWAGLVSAHTQLSLFMTSREERTRHLRLAKEAAIKATTLDDSLAEAHAGLGWIRMHEWDWAGAEDETERALELDPNNPEALAVHAHLLVHLGRFEEGIASQQRLVQIRPGTSFEIMRLSYFFYLADRYHESIEQARMVQEAFPKEENRWEWTADSYGQLGMYLEAVTLCDELAEQDRGGLRCARVYEQAGQGEKADDLRRKMLELSRERYTPPAGLASIYAALGDKDRALDWLDEAYQERSPALHRLKVFPEYDGLRDEPRFQDLMRRLAFPR